MKSFMSTVLACAVILLSSLAPAHSADKQSGQTFKTFELDILPTEEARRAPEEAVLKRIPALKGLADKLVYGPSLGLLTVVAQPEKMGAIEKAVQTYMNRPQIAIMYELRDDKGTIIGFPLMLQEGSDYYSHNSGWRTVGDKNELYHLVAAKALLRQDGDLDGTIQARLKSPNGGENTFSGQVRLKPETPTVVKLAGPDNAEVTLKAVLWRP